MRLLNVRSRIVEEFFGDNVPQYAILSHVWSEEEVTLSEITSPSARRKQGYRKIDYSCWQALKDGLQYVWIDTCCIDKTSSAELSEAINSMFRWYEASRICYAYLEDVTDKESFESSQWFSRGWTLQELIAPFEVMFFGCDWTFLGPRSELLEKISQVTGIDGKALTMQSRLLSTSIARRMSWAAKRQTTRIEDQAYCLLGIFGVNMPLLYGEGDKAFVRLQQEIIKVSTDHSIFAFEKSLMFPRRLLAHNPRQFANGGNIHAVQGTHGTKPYTMTNLGLQIELPLFVHPTSKSIFAVLDIRNSGDPGNHLGLQLHASETEDMTFLPRGKTLAAISPGDIFKAITTTIIIKREWATEIQFVRSGRPKWIFTLPNECLSFDVSSDSMAAKGFKLIGKFPCIYNMKVVFIFRNDNLDNVAIEVIQTEVEQFNVKIHVFGPTIQIRPGTNNKGKGDFLAKLDVIFGEPAAEKSMITSTVISARFQTKDIGSFKVCRLSVQLDDSLLAK